MDQSNKPSSTNYSSSSNKPFLETLPPKTAFFAGFVAAILVLGTIGFVILGSCVLKGNCGEMGNNGSAQAVVVDDGDTAPAADNEDTAPTAAPAVNIPKVTDADHIRGDVNAPITMIEYSDFECPFCSRFHPTTTSILDEYDGKVRLVFRHFPLSFHAEAEPAAEASECAGEQDKFWEFADGLFENQGDLGEKLYLKLASDIGLDEKKFEDCLESDKFLAKVRSDMQDGSAGGVTGTPGSFLIDKDGNTTAVKGAKPLSSITPLIDEMLQ